MIRLSRAQIGSANANLALNPINITASRGLVVSPNWSWVKKLKSRDISEYDYTMRYLKKLDDNKEAVLDWALGLPESTTFLCYCRDGWFCHTYLLIYWLVCMAPKVFINETGWNVSIDHFNTYMQRRPI